MTGLQLSGTMYMYQEADREALVAAGYFAMMNKVRELATETGFEVAAPHVVILNIIIVVRQDSESFRNEPWTKIELEACESVSTGDVEQFLLLKEFCYCRDEFMYKRPRERLNILQALLTVFDTSSLLVSTFVLCKLPFSHIVYSLCLSRLA